MNFNILLTAILVLILIYAGISIYLIKIYTNNKEINLEDEPSKYEDKKKNIRKYYRLKKMSLVLVMIMSVLPILNQGVIGINADGNKIVNEVSEHIETNENKESILAKANESFENLKNTYYTIFLLGASVIFIKTLNDLQTTFINEVDDLYKIKKFKPKQDNSSKTPD
ncbi:hypothetical protein IGJ01_002795 [Enterococcus sp. AZ089]|uniref:hypothetical protein n=1 Tax=Enterococcus sp. AZ089 TaxID=2774693 RepID=UPI003D2FDB52